ncbi:IS110 family RNA-guided transposase [Mucilaginibacter polytrichastri]|uniref:Uncharacterized protein n=1 Tax=Mucilaginibacter polytrichastri TaxID=1302689 RepID=A0A1Q6A2G1_9SPHI|nr:IS110 family transposase [Mucilaginibacter polytrichastri]OKS88196.1 hypothetical protein RG47T_3660 [Mucilaginibacter polytrichastri]SFT08512.1 Transposase [Mucilaginibacter polytrichastri]
MEVSKAKKYTYFIGIDISRNELDFAVMQGNKFLFHREIKNESSEINAIIDSLKKLPKFVMSRAVFGLENTGIYGNHLLNCLKRVKTNIVNENALHIRNSLGNIRGKYDKIDAIRIAQYLYKNRDELNIWKPKRPIVQQLAHLSTLRNRIMTLEKALVTPLKEDTNFVQKKIVAQSKKLIKNSSDALLADFAAIDAFIFELINSDTNLKRMFGIITSVPSVGPVTALQIIITTNEFQDIRNPKKFACYAGVAPFKRDSGLIEGKAKISNMANKRVKALLHTCALSAVRHDPELKAYYERKTKTDGKPKMAVLNAVRNKIVLRIFACLNQDRCFERNYQRQAM